MVVIRDSTSVQLGSDGRSHSSGPELRMSLKEHPQAGAREPWSQPSRQGRRESKGTEGHLEERQGVGDCPTPGRGEEGRHSEVWR